MDKMPVDVSKLFMPHPMQLFLIGTYKEDGQPNLGVFCWINFCWDEELSVTVCMDGNKLTKDRIKETGVFSANLVTETLLPYVDYLGTLKEYDTNKRVNEIKLKQGEVFNVPVLQDSPLNYELEVKKTITLSGSDIFICRIRNAIGSSEIIVNQNAYDLSKVNPVIVSQNSYFGLNKLGNFGEVK